MSQIRLKQLNQDGASPDEVIKWNDTAGKWEPGTGGSGGIGTGTGDPTGGSDGDFYYDTVAQALWYNDTATWEMVGIIADDVTLEVAGGDLHVKDDGIGIDQINAAPTALWHLRANASNDGLEYVAVTGGGDVSGGSTSAVGEVPTYTDANGKTIGRSDIKFGSSSATSGTRTLGASANISGGFISVGGTFVSDGNGSVALGSIQEISGSATVDAGGDGSFAGGFAASITGTGLVSAAGQGAFAWGNLSQLAAGTGTLSADKPGSFVVGSVESGGTIDAITTADGAFSQGKAIDGGTIRCTDFGGFAHGYATGTGSTIISSGAGSFCAGSVAAGGDIAASGDGSVAIGNAGSGQTISASAANSTQLGVGTNAVADSLQVGDTTDGLRLQAGGTTSTVVGSFWTDGTDVFVRSGGANRNLSVASVATRSLTIESPTNAEDFSFFFTTVAITATNVAVTVRGATPSITGTLVYDSARNSGAPTTIHTMSAVTSVTGTDGAPSGTATIPADSYVWFESTAVGAATDELFIGLTFTED